MKRTEPKRPPLFAAPSELQSSTARSAKSMADPEHALSAVRHLVADNPSRDVLAAFRRDVVALLGSEEAFAGFVPVQSDCTDALEETGLQAINERTSEGRSVGMPASVRESVAPASTSSRGALSSATPATSSGHGSELGAVSPSTSRGHIALSRHSSAHRSSSAACCVHAAGESETAAGGASAADALDTPAAAQTGVTQITSASGTERVVSAQSSESASSRARGESRACEYAAALHEERVAEGAEVAKLKAQLQAATRGFLRKETALRNEIAVLRGDECAQGAVETAEGSLDGSDVESAESQRSTVSAAAGKRSAKKSTSRSSARLGSEQGGEGVQGGSVRALRMQSSTAYTSGVEAASTEVALAKVRSGLCHRCTGRKCRFCKSHCSSRGGVC